MTRPHDHISIGVIGAGRIAQAAHLPVMAKAAGVRLTAVCDRSEALAHGVGAHYGVPGLSQVEELLALDVDAVLIATPDRSHLPLGQQALEAGKHVLMEKPLAATSADARKLVDLAMARGLRLQTGNMKRHDPALEFARASLGRVGRILSLQTWYRVMASSRAAIQRTLFPPLLVDETVQATEAEYKADVERYRLLTHGAHVFDGLRYLAGDVDWIAAHRSTVADDLTWHGTAGIADGGGLASFELTTNVHGEWAEGMDIHGELGTIRIRSPYVFTRMGSWVELYVEAEGVAQVPHFGDTDPFKRQLESFARAILEGHETDPSPEDGVRTLQLVEATAESVARGGARVDLP